MENYIQQANLLKNAALQIEAVINVVGREELSDIYGSSISDTVDCLEGAAKELIKQQLQYNLLYAVKELGMCIRVNVSYGEYKGWYDVGEIYPATLELEIITGESEQTLIPFSSILEWRLGA